MRVSEALSWETRAALLLAAGWLLAGCGLGPTSLSPAEETRIAARIYQTQTAAAPTVTSSPIPTRTSTPTPVPAAVVNVSLLKAYAGPGFSFDSIAQFAYGDALVILGRNWDCSWLKVTAPFEGEGWVNTLLERVVLNVHCDSLPHATYRPENGDIILDERASIGRGELEIENGNSSDALVLLVASQDVPIYGTYVRSSDRMVLAGIPDGRYLLYVSTGSGWDIVDQRFTIDPAYMRFEEALEYRTTSTQYVVWSITLYAVPGGTADTETLPPDAFPSISGP